MDSMITSSITLLEANEVLSGLGDNFRTEVNWNDEDEFPDPRDIHRFAVVFSPDERGKIAHIQGIRFRLLVVKVGVWISSTWEDSQKIAGKGDEVGLDDVCSEVEDELSYSQLGDSTIMTPDEDEGLGIGVPIAGKSENLRGWGYELRLRRVISDGET